MALIGLTDKILFVINNRDYVIGAFLDPSKAFDKVQNTIFAVITDILVVEFPKGQF